MNTVQAVASALGLGLLAGIRLYATVLAVGLSVRLGLVHLPPALAELAILADTRVLAVAGAATLIEFFADKVPWVDSAWDAVHTFIRPIGAALLGATALANADPGLRMTVMLLCGGVALAGHSTKAATRFAVNHSPEPLSNIALSLAGDVSIPVAVWLWSRHPYIMAGVVLAFLIVFAVVAPRVCRFLHVEWVAFKSWLTYRKSGTVRQLPEGLTENLRRVLAAIRGAEVELPPEYSRAVGKKTGRVPPLGWRCAAGPGVAGLRASVGYLSVAGERVVFVARRWFRIRVHTLELSAVREARLERRLLVDILTIDLGDRREAFDLFKTPEPDQTREAARHPAARTHTPA